MCGDAMTSLSTAHRARTTTTCLGRAQRRPERGAERSDGPCGTFPCAPADERSAMGCAGNLALQHLTHCACPSVVNAVNGASCAMQPMARAPQVARSASAGTGAPGSPSFAYFSWRSKKSESSCGGEIPASSRRSTVVVLAGTRGRDMHPAVQSLSLAPPRESNQREGGPGAPVPALALRATCGARGLGALHNSHHSLRSFSSDKCNESVHEARGSPRRPGHCAPRRGHRGGSGVTHGPSLRSARGN
ncbi:hypothetical protein DES41_1064 [Pseudorhodoferax soli]|uniref:Uncharacterized protein n=1 Tax=Pseudorhodoferax soli TaxID=545864 RepID=A0A368XMD1_9BURK|nr:hypothetical protein DES41_1064 [Pseudorhodoferax soli]